jgi:type I restriction enzyme, S subunit
MSESTENIYGGLPITWQLTTLGELIKIKKVELQTGPFGTMLHASSYKDIGTPVLAVQHIGNNRIIHGLDIPRVDVETHQRLSRYEIKVNDIIFSRKGAVERTALVTEKENGWLQGSDCIRLRLIDSFINPVYLSYIFCSSQYKKWIIQHAHGATMPSLNQQIISLSPLPLPPIAEQQKIAITLSCLDAKIENLRRQNETLEAIAQTLFKHWFIDFEFPNADGKPYKSSGGAMVGALGILKM